VFKRVIYRKSHLLQLFTVNFKPNVSSSWLVRQLKNARDLTDHELICRRIVRSSFLQSSERLVLSAVPSPTFCSACEATFVIIWHFSRCCYLRTLLLRELANVTNITLAVDTVPPTRVWDHAAQHSTRSEPYQQKPAERWISNSNTSCSSVRGIGHHLHTNEWHEISGFLSIHIHGGPKSKPLLRIIIKSYWKPLLLLDFSSISTTKYKNMISLC